MPLTPEQKSEILKLRGMGYGYHKISSSMGIKRDQVRDFCRTKVASSMEVKSDHLMSVRKLYTCLNCGDDYFKRDSDINSRVFCSDECRKETKKKRRKQRLIEKEDRLPAARCLGCGSDFKKRRDTDKCCSTQCGKDYRRKIRYPWKYETRKCICCGTCFIPNREKQKYCSNKCAGKGTIKNHDRSKTHDEFVEELKNRFEGVIEVLSEYKNGNKKLKYRCRMCEYEFEREPKFMLRGIGCPQCSKTQSVGVLRIEEWLIKNNIAYEKEYRINECRNVYPLPFDFAILDDGFCVGIIEFNGEHHKKSVEHWGGDGHLERTMRNDTIKRNYCFKNNIPLIDIDYSEQNNIDDILNENIKRKIAVNSRTGDQRTIKGELLV